MIRIWALLHLNVIAYYHFFFRNSHVKFVRRKTNEVAHALAWMAPSLAIFHNFIDVPTCIQNIISNEMS